MSLRKHSVNIRGHSTSLSIEDEFWDTFRAIARDRNMPLARLITQIDEQRTPDRNLSSAIRVFVLKTLQQAVDNSEDG